MHRQDPSQKTESASDRSSFSVNSIHPMAGILQGAIAGMPSAGQIRQSVALAYWPQAVGALAARSTQAVEVRNRILFVRTKSSSWSHELSMQKTNLIRNLNRMLQGDVIADIKFRTDGATWVEELTVPDRPTAEELDRVVLGPQEQAELMKNLASLQSVEAAHTRRALRVRVTREAKLRQWRLERGWKVCLRCNSLHNTPDALCPICRLIP